MTSDRQKLVASANFLIQAEMTLLGQPKEIATGMLNLKNVILKYIIKDRRLYSNE